MVDVYNRRAAADYALKWAIKYNPHWGAVTNDCTSFVSQALFAGGWSMIRGRPTDYRAWYSGGAESFCDGTCRFERSFTWGGAEPFITFLVVSRRALPCFKTDLEIGDIVQLLDQQGQAHHSMIVTQVDSKIPEYYLSYHTKDRRNVPRPTIIKPGFSRFIFWKVKDHIPKSYDLSDYITNNWHSL